MDKKKSRMIAGCGEATQTNQLVSRRRSRNGSQIRKGNCANQTSVATPIVCFNSMAPLSFFVKQPALRGESAAKEGIAK